MGFINCIIPNIKIKENAKDAFVINSILIKTKNIERNINKRKKDDLSPVKNINIIVKIRHIQLVIKKVFLFYICKKNIVLQVSF